MKPLHYPLATVLSLPKRRRQKTRALKQTMMQELLIGKTRLL